MSEPDVVELALSQAGAFGFRDWFAKPEVRFDGAKSVFHRPSASNVLKKGTLVEIDLAPSTDNAFGDYGTGLCFGVDEEPPIVTEAREACRAICGFASRFKTVGELFVFAESWANNHRVSLGGARSVGHMVPLCEGLFATAWPNRPGGRLPAPMPGPLPQSSAGHRNLRAQPRGGRKGHVL